MQMTQPVIQELSYQGASRMEKINLLVDWCAKEATTWRIEKRQEVTPADARMCVHVDLTVNLHVTPASPRF